MAVTRNANETNAPWPPTAHRLVFFKIANVGSFWFSFLLKHSATALPNQLATKIGLSELTSQLATFPGGRNSIISSILALT